MRNEPGIFKGCANIFAGPQKERACIYIAITSERPGRGDFHAPFPENSGAESRQFRSDVKTGLEAKMTVNLSKSNAKEVARARDYLGTGMVDAYARAMSGLHRAASERQQQAIWDEIAADGFAGECFDKAFRYGRSAFGTVSLVAAESGWVR